MKRNSMEWTLLLCATLLFLSMQFACVCASAAVPDAHAVTITSYVSEPNTSLPYSHLKMSGKAGVGEQILTPQVTDVDLSHLPELYTSEVRVDVTTAATRAVLQSKDLSPFGGIPYWGSISLNGVIIGLEAGDDAARIVDKVNAVSGLSGVTAALNDGIITFSSIGYGSNAFVSLGGMDAYYLLDYPRSATVNGIDARAVVTDSEGNNLTDAVWSSGDGLLLRDSLGDSITLAEDAGTAVQNLGPAVYLTMEQVDRVQWCNTTTGDRGICNGANAWSVDSINLAPCQNSIEVTAHYQDGTVRSASLQVDATPVESTVRIGGPTQDPVFVTHDSVLDVAGTADVPYPTGVKTTILNPYIVSAADLSHVNLTESADVTLDVITAAMQVRYTGSVDLSAGLFAAETVVINGVSIDIAAGNMASIKTAINGKTAETGVTASDNGCHLILTGDYGSAADITISGSGASAVFGTPIKTMGFDAWAIVCDADGYAVGGIWTGYGRTLRDDLGNYITFTERGNSVATYLDQIHLDVWPEPYLEYTNWATGETRRCEGLISWSASSVGLVSGENLIQVKLIDGHSEDVSDYIMVEYYAPVSTPGQARRMNDGAYVSLADQVVTASDPDAGTYIESADRCSGMRIVGAEVQRGNLVSLDGVLSTVDGERVLVVDSPSVAGTGSVAPLAMTNAAITSAHGPDTAGLLVRTSGRVLSIDEAENAVVIDDGSRQGIHCVLPGSVTADQSWKYLAVTGIAAQGMLKVRDADDVTVVE